MLKYTVLIILFLATHSVSAATCFNPQTECVEPGSTKYFDGIPVTLDCWRYKITYECKVDANNNCQELRSQGCSLAAASCKSLWNGSCGVQEVVYDCPTSKCFKQELPINNPYTFCAKGECMEQTRSKDKDLKKSLAALSAAADAANYLDTVDPRNPKIFKGKDRECSINIAKDFTKDCCGKDPNGFLEGKILQCEKEELEVGHAREKGSAIYLGEYCHNKVLGVCTSYHHTYCIYQSKLARIIQEAARAQLGINLGGPSNPICPELTMEQFTKIDFSKVDFREFYQDLEHKMQGSEMHKTTELKNQLRKNAEELKQHSATYTGNVEKMRERMQAKMRNVPVKTEEPTEKAIMQRELDKQKGWE